MPTANVRYGRPKGSGLDDRQQLESVAALLAANPKLKPTTAIRSLGVEDPSTIRRLRDKLRNEQGTLTAETCLATRAIGMQPPSVSSNMSTPAAALPPSRALVPVAPGANAVAPIAISHAFLMGWCDVAFSMLNATAAAQATLTREWLAVPPVAAAVRRQLALGSLAISLCSRRKRNKRTLH